MKITQGIILFAAFLVGAGAKADILTLTDPASIPVPPGTHADTYDFPTVLLDPSNPIETLEVIYENSPPGGETHAIVSAHFLFDPNVTFVEPLIQTSSRYEARAWFNIPVTDVSDAWSPGFLAIHENTYTLTSLMWTATYSDGTQRVHYDGIIPEPSSVSLILVGSGLFYLRRKMFP